MFYACFGRTSITKSTWWSLGKTTKSSDNIRSLNNLQFHWNFIVNYAGRIETSQKKFMTKLSHCTLKNAQSVPPEQLRQHKLTEALFNSQPTSQSHSQTSSQQQHMLHSPIPP
uniref:Uncharacterized protein n=1 Tax=Timspurckia oligopyrenoides TaxID=708627 RepID=A0A7S0ZI82_9RHOD|mmetsp:Transcript_6370/g.11359  ORF Transcript_6370/g.11359 Transcript_6370/m.11359 type:complete len:113 (+) Transcript_6370:104-442(+)